ncbi:MAG: ATP-binding protein, partial [Gammaproteobacteria bacterium]|nr:ATP-binding protein [Gammaproteobacteria bacterium]
LTAVIAGLSVAVTTEGYYATTLLLGIVTVILIVELHQYVTKTNTELTRFLEAARYGDYGQQFYSSGAGFENLAEVFNDIMKHFKASRQEQEENLRHLKSLTEHIPVPLLSLYPDGRVQLHNNAARRFFSGVTIKKLEDLNAFGENFYAAIKNIEPGKRVLVNFFFDEMERQLSVVATQIITGTASEKLISMQDIQSELDDVQLQAWQELVRVLTHEMMNSITPIASLAKTAADLMDDAEKSVNTVPEELAEARRAVDTVAQRSDSLMQFVQSYRSLTQLQVPQKQKLLVKDLFIRVKELFAEQWREQGIDCKIHVEPDSLQFYVDPDLLEQLLINLLRNAAQALEGCDKPQVTMAARLNQRGLVLLEVTDNGPGISADIADKVFIPFFTTKKQGSGVGLALTRQIMSAHGGTVALNESENGGARITLVF